MKKSSLTGDDLSSILLALFPDFETYSDLIEDNGDISDKIIHNLAFLSKEKGLINSDRRVEF
jgi:hypothetical protein